MASPAPPPPLEQPAFSALLPAASLIGSLVHAAADLASLNELPFLQTRNVAAAVRRAKILCSLFEDVRDSTAPLPPSSVVWLNELFSVLRKTKSVIEEFAGGSSLWSLVQTELVACQFHACVQELARALDILPLGLLGVSGDVQEQIELLHKQAKRAEVSVDTRELRLRDELLQVMAKNRRKDGGEHSIKGFDSKKVEEILWSIGLRSAAHYREEIRRLEDEARKQAGTGGLVAVSNVHNLISLVSYSESVVFHGEFEQQRPLQTKLRSMVSFPKGLSRSTTWSASTSSASPLSSMVFNVPDEFRCPISLDLMRDPVIVASGHTYDRSSIAQWINSGHHTCPKSGQKLIHMALIPNYALKSLIHQWCKENNVHASFLDQDAGNGGRVGDVSNPSSAQAIDHISAVRAATEAVRMTAEFLVGKLAMGSPEIQRQAAYEVRLLAKANMDNRRIIAEAGAIPFLVTLLSSPDPRTEENAVTALLNLSIFHNNKILIMAAGAADGIIKVLQSGSTKAARENAAAAIYSLSVVDEYKVAIGARPGAIMGLVTLLRDGKTAGKKDAATAICNLAIYQGNKAPVVAAGAVPVLVGLLMDDRAGITDDALQVLAQLCGCGEGLKEIGESKAVVSILVELMRFGSQKGKEHAIAVLLGLCRDRDAGEEVGRRLLMNPKSVPSLQSMAADGSPRASRKADALLRLLNRCCSQSQRPVVV